MRQARRFGYVLLFLQLLVGLRPAVAAAAVAPFAGAQEVPARLDAGPRNGGHAAHVASSRTAHASHAAPGDERGPVQGDASGSQESPSHHPDGQGCHGPSAPCCAPVLVGNGAALLVAPVVCPPRERAASHPAAPPTARRWAQPPATAPPVRA